jgi:enoyl-CoA hydratase/carnithine racemase
MGIGYEKDGHIAKVALGLQETKNALGPDELLQLNEIWSECQEDDFIRVVVLYSSLDNVFCSGLNLKTAIPIWSGMRPPATDAEKWFLDDHKSVGKATLKYKELDKPVIVAVNGLCVTIGFEMVMGCELRIASESATFQMIETKLGIMPMMGANVFLRSQIGAARAMEILLTGNAVKATTLFEWGFLNRIVAKAKVMDEAMSLAESIAGNGPKSIQGMVRCAREIQGKSLKEALEIEHEIGKPIFMSEDVHEGINAFREKRMPNFK